MYVRSMYLVITLLGWGEGVSDVVYYTVRSQTEQFMFFFLSLSLEGVVR